MLEKLPVVPPPLQTAVKLVAKMMRRPAGPLARTHRPAGRQQWAKGPLRLSQGR